MATDDRLLLLFYSLAIGFTAGFTLLDYLNNSGPYFIAFQFGACITFIGWYIARVIKLKEEAWSKQTMTGE